MIIERPRQVVYSIIKAEMPLIDHNLLLYKCLWRQVIGLLCNPRSVSIETDGLDQLLTLETVLGRKRTRLLWPQPILRVTI